MRFTASDGASLAYDDEGTGPVVVLVAGYGAPRASWALQRRHLVAEGFRVVSVDRRHTGESDFTGGQRMSRQGLDLVELCDGLALDRPAVVGSSMGGSAVLAGISLAGTRWLSRACVVDQTPKVVNEGDWELGFYDLRLETVEAWVAAFPDGLNAFHAPPPPEALEVLIAAAGAPFDLDGTRALLRDHVLADWRDVVAGCDVPLLALAGAHSTTWPPASSRWMADAAPYGSFVELPDSGHAPHLSEPAAFNAALVDWLRA